MWSPYINFQTCMVNFLPAVRLYCAYTAPNTTWTLTLRCKDVKDRAISYLSLEVNCPKEVVESANSLVLALEQHLKRVTEQLIAGNTVENISVGLQMSLVQPLSRNWLLMLLIMLSMDLKLQ